MKVPSPDRKHALIALSIAAIVLVVNWATPHELNWSDQGKQAQYVLDALQHGHWISPTDQTIGEAATKPPLYAWIAAALALLVGHVDPWILRIPVVLAAFALVAVVFEIGRRLGGPRVACVAAVALATNHHFTKMSIAVRPDGILSLLLALQLLVYLRCREDGRETKSRVATLCALSAGAWIAKGPAALLAPLIVLVHLVFTREPRRAWKLAALPALTGVVAFFAWFAAALRVNGEAVWRDMVVGEAVRHATSGSSWNPLYYVPILFARMIPWSILFIPAGVLMWREWRTPREESLPLGFTLPLAWVTTMTLAFGVLPHKRPDLIYVAEPAMALLVARFIESSAWRWPKRALPWVIAAGLVLLGIESANDLRIDRRYPLAAFGRDAQAEARRRGARLVHVGFKKSSPLFYLGIAAQPMTEEEIARIEGPVLVVAPEEMRGGLETALGPLEVLEAADGNPVSSDPPRLVLCARAGR